MTSTASHLVLGFAAVALLTAGCGGPGPGLSQAQAVKVARVDAQQASSTPVTFVSAASGPFSEFAASAVTDPGREVWAVVFRGTFPPVSCGPAAVPPATQAPCPAGNATIQIVIDYVTGKWILSETPAGSG
jgi:hypothetical protein